MLEICTTVCDRQIHNPIKWRDGYTMLVIRLP